MAAIILHVISNDLGNFRFLNTWCTLTVVNFWHDMVTKMEKGKRVDPVKQW